MKKLILLLMLISFLSAVAITVINTSSGDITISNGSQSSLEIKNPVYPDTLPATLPFKL